jgi:hypothetical protein
MTKQPRPGVDPVQRNLRLSVPSFLLVLGYGLFYLQVTLGWWSPQGLAAWFLSAGAVLALGVALALGAQGAYRLFIEATDGLTSAQRRLLAGTCLFAVSALIFGMLKPAHLVQEEDFLSYHLMQPKQHWLAGNWRPLEWSHAEFRALLVQYGLSWLWLGLPLLNRIPQALLTLFMTLRLWHLVSLLSGKARLAGLLSVLALLAFRGVFVQVGTAMLDLPSLYFLVGLACAIVLLMRGTSSEGERRWISGIAGIDLAAYLGSKSFNVAFLLVVAVITLAALRAGWRPALSRLRSGLRPVALLTPVLLLWVPNAYRTFHFTGDPFYPVMPAAVRKFCVPERLTLITCRQLEERAELLQRDLLNAYGVGRDPWSAVKSFFLVALPNRGEVVNRFDYPLGVAWYLAWALLLAVLVRGPSRRAALYALVLAVALYLLWFQGSQQSRWLYPAIAVLAAFAGPTLCRFAGAARWASLMVLCAMVGINSLRAYRSQRGSMGCIGQACLKGRYLEDYRTPCSVEPMVVPDARFHGYLNCRFWTGKAEINPY